jgi:NET1-associated nuclear protein 1 (U3 small nucleolar RNA-associated protein 17)
MAETNAQLKRKRESAAGLQKKAKKQRKSDTIAGQDAGAEEVVTAESTPGKQATPQPQDKSKSKSQKAQTNGVRDQEATNGTPSSLKADKQDVETESLLGDADTAVVQKSFKEKVAEAKEAAKEGSNKQMSTSTPAKKQKHKNKWTVSQTQGGWFLPMDPVFSQDEKYVLIANAKAIHVYLSETSLLAHLLPVGATGLVTAYALSSTKPDQLYVADSNGLITLWNWVDATKVGRWDIGAVVRNMVVVTQPGSDEDLVYCHETGDKHIVNVHALRTKAQASQTELKRVLKTNSAITNLQVLLQGKYVIIATADTITVGKRVKVTKTALQEFEYVWRELKFSKRITTCNTYFRQREVLESGKKSAQDQRDVLDLAVGDEVGVILLFEDILASFAAVESLQKGSKTRTDSADSLRPKKLHWHRDAVGAVKWSLDGKSNRRGRQQHMLT